MPVETKPYPINQTPFEKTKVLMNLMNKYHWNITIIELAKKTGYSKSSISTYFKKLFIPEIRPKIKIQSPKNF
jgi:hypothetical protein